MLGRLCSLLPFSIHTLHPPLPTTLLGHTLAPKQVIDPYLGRNLRPHQREGVTFMYECVMGLKSGEHLGCLLADEMGLG